MRKSVDPRYRRRQGWENQWTLGLGVFKIGKREVRLEFGRGSVTRDVVEIDISLSGGSMEGMTSSD